MVTINLIAIATAIAILSLSGMGLALFFNFIKDTIEDWSFMGFFEKTISILAIVFNLSMVIAVIIKEIII